MGFSRQEYWSGLPFPSPGDLPDPGIKRRSPTLQANALTSAPTYNPAIPLLGIYPDKTIIQKDTCIPMLTAALFTVAKIWKQSKCPSTDEHLGYFHVLTVVISAAMNRGVHVSF